MSVSYDLPDSYISGSHDVLVTEFEDGPELLPISVGDVVALRSGSTAMTVGEVGTDQCGCAWMDESGKPHKAHIFPAMLARLVRRPIVVDDGVIRHVWCFADTGAPIADHIALKVA